MSPIDNEAGDRLLLPREVENRVRLSGATIFRLSRKRLFPEPLVLGLKHRIAYRESEFERWIENRARASYCGVAA